MGTASQLLQGVEEAFVVGRDRPLQHTDASSGRQYSELLQASLASRLSPEELAFMDSCTSRRDEALLAARQNQLEQARHGFDEIWEGLHSESLSTEGRLLVQVFLEPAEAYLYYKLGDYSRACELIFHASALDRTLVTDFGYAILSAHPLQLGHNLLRIQTRLGERSYAVYFAGSFLDYLELRVESIPDAVACARAVLDSVPDTILKYYFDKICGEVALLLAGSTDMGTAELFRPLAHHADPNGCLSTGFGVHAHAWLYCKQLALRGQLEAFLVTATDLLRIGRMSEPSLWFATIIEVVGFCRSLGPEGLRLVNWISAEASKLTDAPWALRHAVWRA